jgi:hypothetical protein
MDTTSKQPPLQLVEIVGEFTAASNVTLLAIDADGSKWVYKADRAMADLWDFDSRSLPRREVAAFLLSGALGFDLIPPTYLAMGPLGPGSAQRFIEIDEFFDVRPLFVPKVSDVLWPLAVFDVLANNADRKLGHLLFEKGGRMWAIDNGLTFHPDPKLRTVLWGLAGRSVPEEHLAAVEDVRTQLAGDLGRELGDLLDRDAVRGIDARARSLLATRTHPNPPTDRPAVPWPIW